MEKKLEEKLLYELEHHSFRKYSENYLNSISLPLKKSADLKEKELLMQK